MKHWTKWSVLICLLIGWGVWKYNLLSRLSASDARTFLGLLAQVSVTMLGFLLAALAILASIAGHRLVRNMQKTGHYRVLLSCFFIDTVAYGFAAAVALVAYLANTHLILGTLLAMVSFLFASLLLLDVGWRFWLVLTHLGPDNN
ncbi:hypothetical protein VA599_06545 [Chromobacterium sp. TRC.1.1.SA]|uniref:Uncharacterized protein n=1 Tax=Chromobacterium indicum TaxID=3110228 RepID=A0ABV0CGT2_9NEIS